MVNRLQDQVKGMREKQGLLQELDQNRAETMTSFVEYLSHMHEIINELSNDEKIDGHFNFHISGKRDSSPKTSKNNLRKATDALKRLNINVFRTIANEKKLVDRLNMASGKASSQVFNPAVLQNNIKQQVEMTELEINRTSMGKYKLKNISSPSMGSLGSNAFQGLPKLTRKQGELENKQSQDSYSLLQNVQSLVQGPIITSSPNLMKIMNDNRQNQIFTAKDSSVQKERNSFSIDKIIGEEMNLDSHLQET